MADALVADADGHVIERAEGPGDVLDFVPGDVGRVNGRRVLPHLDRFHSPGGSIVDRSRERREGFQPADAKRWGDFMDAAGIGWAVLYPTEGLAIGRVAFPDWAITYCRAYNDWIHEKFMGADPRLKGVAMLPMQDVPAAVEELRRAVTDLGMVAAMLPSNGLRFHLSHRMFWPIYEEAQRLDCALAVHGGSYEGLGFDTYTVFPATRALGMPIPLMTALTGFMVDGVLDAFPNLRVAFLEGGTAWVPLVLDRLSRELEYGGLQLKHSPEDYFKQGRLFVSCEGNEKALSYVISRVGPESVLFASDFPHEISAENCRGEIDEILARGDIREEHKMAILAENAARLYKIS